QAEAALEQAAADRNRDAAATESAAAKAAAAEPAALAAAILDVAALVVVQFHGSVSIRRLYMGTMSLTVATWNINSVRLRIANVARFLKWRQPDVLCLQETKCPDEFFPHEAFEQLGYSHRLVQVMNAYNGVAIPSYAAFTAY